MKSCRFTKKTEKKDVWGTDKTNGSQDALCLEKVLEGHIWLQAEWYSEG